MNEIIAKMEALKIFSSLPNYSYKLFQGVFNAIKEGRETDISRNSILMIERMYSNRFN
jgi:hypothetical protein